MIIYKYIDIDGAKKMAENKSVVLKCPTEYNDPFDSVFKVDEKEREKAFKLFLNYQLFKEFYSLFFLQNKKPDKNKFYGKVLKENVKQISNAVKRTGIYKTQPDLAMYYALASKTLKKNDKNLKSQFNKMIDGVLDTMRDRVILSCFGSTYDSVLMWSHYADSHKGFCVRYEFEENLFDTTVHPKKDKLLFVDKIRYSETIDIGDEPSIRMALLEKSNFWKYEKEMRLVSFDCSGDDEDFPTIMCKGMAKAIYLGAKCTDANRRLMEKAIGDKNIPLYQMSVDENKLTRFKKTLIG